MDDYIVFYLVQLLNEQVCVCEWKFNSVSESYTYLNTYCISSQILAADVNFKSAVVNILNPLKWNQHLNWEIHSLKVNHCLLFPAMPRCMLKSIANYTCNPSAACAFHKQS